LAARDFPFLAALNFRRVLFPSRPRFTWVR
jgi:hypothetical protein